MTRKADLAAVVMQEGLAYVCLVTSSMTLTRQRIEMSIPRKQGAAAMGRDKAINKFYDAVIRAILQHVDFAVVKALLIASPGFVKDAFMTYLQATAHKTDLKCLMDHRNKFVLCHCSSGQKHALKEVLAAAHREQARLVQLEDAHPGCRGGLAGVSRRFGVRLSVRGSTPGAGYHCTSTSSSWMIGSTTAHGPRIMVT